MRRSDVHGCLLVDFRLEHTVEKEQSTPDTNTVEAALLNAEL